MQSSRHSILIVEDEPMLLKAYQVRLGNEGFSISTATNGKEALDILSTLQPDLIITDIVMPVMNGIQFLQELQKRGIPVKIPVLVLSNLDQSENEKIVLGLGAREYLVKSEITIHDISNKVLKYLS